MATEMLQLGFFFTFMSVMMGVTEGITCFECKYDSVRLHDTNPFVVTGPTSCGPDFDESGPDVGTVECGIHVDSCSLVLFYHGKALTGIQRGCAFDSSCQEGCLEGSQIKTCFHCCGENFCNTSSTNRFSVGLLLFAALWAFLLVHFGRG
nr:uncharacterized protein LOC129262929 [Lytechinus pictus]